MSPFSKFLTSPVLLSNPFSLYPEFGRGESRLGSVKICTPYVLMEMVPLLFLLLIPFYSTASQLPDEGVNSSFSPMYYGPSFFLNAPPIPEALSNKVYESLPHPFVLSVLPPFYMLPLFALPSRFLGSHGHFAELTPLMKCNLSLAPFPFNFTPCSSITSTNSSSLL